MEKARVGQVPFRKRIGVRTYFALVAVSVLAVSASSVGHYLLSSRIIRSNVTQRNLQIARRAADEIRLFIDESIRSLQSIATGLGPLNDPWVLDAILENATATYRKFPRIHLFAANGQIEASSNLENAEAKYDTSILTKSIQQNSLEISRVMLSIGHLPYISLALPVTPYGPSEKFVYADLNLREIWTLVDDISFGDSGKTILVDRDKTLIAHPDKTKILNAALDVKILPTDLAYSLDSGFYVTEDTSGVKMLAAAASIPMVDWYVVLLQQLTEAFVPATDMILITGLVGIVVFMAAIFASLILVRRLASPLNRLLAGTKIISRGDLTHRIQVASQDEIGQLSRSFNGMVGDLQQWSVRLASSEEKYRLLAENINDVIFAMDKEARITYVNRQAEMITGYKIDELINQHVADFLLDEDQASLEELLATRRLDRGIEAEILQRDGNTITLEVKIVREEEPQQGVYYYGVARDITERKKAEAKLAEYQTQLRSLASQLTLTEAKERKKIASLIHDRIIQALALARIKLGTLNARGLTGEDAKIVTDTLPILEQIIQDTRSLIFTVSSPLLYELGLGAALEQLVEQFQDEHPIDFSFVALDQQIDLDTDVSLLLFEAVKELLINCVKHSQAQAATVRMAVTKDLLTVSVRDNGVGMQKNENGNPRKGGFGLFSIKERLDHIGGRVTISSDHGDGTEMVLMVPVRQPVEV